MLDEADKTVAELSSGDRDESDAEVCSILRQISQDVERTMPENRNFDDGAEGGIKLRRILVAYSVHVNREIGKFF